MEGNKPLNTTQIIFLNGPAGSGKDTIGKFLFNELSFRNYKVKLEKFAKPLKARAKALFDLTDEEADYFLETQIGKQAPIGNDYKQDMSFRDLLIADSEIFLKKVFGENVFGKLLLERLLKGSLTCKEDFVIITDSGFMPETCPIINYFGKDNCFLFKLQRKGTNFSGDSRGYIDLKNIPTKELDNNRELVEVVDDILDILGENNNNNGEDL